MSGKSQMTSVMHQLIVPAQRIVDNERRISQRRVKINYVLAAREREAFDSAPT